MSRVEIYSVLVNITLNLEINYKLNYNQEKILGFTTQYICASTIDYLKYWSTNLGFFEIVNIQHKNVITDKIYQ